MGFSTLFSMGASVLKLAKFVTPAYDQSERRQESFVLLRDYRREGKRAAVRRRERGEGKLKAVLYTVVFALLILVAVKIVPPYVAEYQLVDKMQEQARFGVVNRYSEDQIRDILFKTVQDLDIPVKREDIKVLVTQAKVTISVDYTVPIDFYIYQTSLHFTPTSENKSLT